MHGQPPARPPPPAVMNGPASARRKVCITIQSVNLNVRGLFGSTSPVRTLGFFGVFLCRTSSGNLKQTVAEATTSSSNQMFGVFFPPVPGSKRHPPLSSRPEVLSGKQMGRRSRLTWKLDSPPRRAATSALWEFNYALAGGQRCLRHTD